MSRALRIAIAGGLVLLALAALALSLAAGYDWNRARPWLQQKVEQASGRTLEIRGELALSWHASQGEKGWRAWLPWPRIVARDIVFGNASWSSQPVMLTASGISLTVNPLAALEKRVLIPVLELDAPALLLERNAEGQANWDFPDGGGGWEFGLRRLAVNGGRVEIRDAVRQLSLDAEAEAPDDETLAWRFSGSMQNEPLEGEGSSARVLALENEHVNFPLSLRLRSGSTRIDAKGALSAPRSRPGLDLRLQVEGVSMARLYPLTGLLLPETPPFSTAGRLLLSREQEGLHWRYEDFSGKMGATDLHGTLIYHPREPRPLLEGRVTSKLLRVADLAPLLGVDSRDSRKRRGDRTVQPQGKLFPVAPFRSERWQGIDTDVELRAAKAMRRKAWPVEDLHAHVRLQGGLLRIAPLRFAAAGGEVNAEISLDGRRKPVQAEMTLSARRLKLARLLPEAPGSPGGSGELSADARLQGRGHSFAAVLGAAGGEVRTAIDRGSLSKRLLDSMGMNFGSLLLTNLFGDRQVDIRCAAGDFTVEKGVLRPRAFVVDTDQAELALDGRILLGEEKLDLTIHPHPKGVQLLSLRTPLHVRGSIAKPELEADRGVLALRAGSALALGLLAPLGAALLPLIEVGPGETNACAGLIASASP
ncbi:AsmA family protein [Noviherbaspirillum aridicola]|uniref:AsmA domain-containing protein n=1 Tax=Noviherbaspirillum aridicola TaxID=2849687 RepID=A0ABQ4Q7V3_9BURK|nr:AsmA family protein [Noviherbaspirillum aridicola]GIZ53132.1 hypothetical protein NCCP691_31460 [Noviherbaspirillum aridicola]